MPEGFTRRDVVRGIAVGVPLAAALSDPAIAKTVAAGLETISIETAGGRTVSAALAVPATSKAPAVLLIHEWWGLNDQIKTVAAEFAKIGYVALAVDLYGGKVAGSPEEAGAMMQSVDSDAATDTLVSWIDWLRGHDRANGKIATVGWCFGGGWSLNASIVTPVDATVVYYGRVAKTAGEVAHLRGPVLGHFATQDKFINKAMVDGFEKAMRDAGKPFTTNWYDANHAFANPTGASYDAEDAKLAWSRTLSFLKETL